LRFVVVEAKIPEGQSTLGGTRIRCSQTQNPSLVRTRELVLLPWSVHPRKNRGVASSHVNSEGVRRRGGGDVPVDGVWWHSQFVISPPTRLYRHLELWIRQCFSDANFSAHFALAVLPNCFAITLSGLEGEVEAKGERFRRENTNEEEP